TPIRPRHHQAVTILRWPFGEAVLEEAPGVVTQHRLEERPEHLHLGEEDLRPGVEGFGHGRGPDLLDGVAGIGQRVGGPSYSAGYLSLRCTTVGLGDDRHT